MMLQSNPSSTHMTGPQVCAWFGVSSMTVWRWLRNETLGFPQPDLLINGRRYWKADRITTWKPPAAASTSEREAA